MPIAAPTLPAQIVAPMPHIPPFEGALALTLARGLANSRNDGGARLPESTVFNTPSMSITASAMRALTLSHMLPSEASHLPLLNFALSLTVERTHLPPGALPDALLHMSLALLPNPVL